MSAQPEYDLLLDAIVPLEHARVDPRGWHGGRWGQTLNAAAWHRVSPILFSHLGPEHDAPAAVLSGLERAYLASAARNLFIRATVDRVVEALVAADAPPMLLKGAALVETVYRDPAQREMLDIDVLIPADRIATATAALEDVGYRPVAETDDASAAPDAVRVAAHHDQPLVGGDQLVAVELHRHVAIAGEGRGFGVEGFWERARTAPATGHLLPSAEDLLLHVCFHFTRNRLGGSHQRRNTGGALAQICDIARIVEHEPLDWDLLSANARGYGLGPRVFLALFAARELGVAVPGPALASLEPPGFDRRLGRQLVALRVLRGGDHLPARSLRWMFAPSREVLSRGWNADSTATLSLARAYLRRARAQAPRARSALRRPWLFVQDQRLNGQIETLEDRA